MDIRVGMVLVHKVLPDRKRIVKGLDGYGVRVRLQDGYEEIIISRGYIEEYYNPLIEDNV
jgi:hypothetical protein